MKNKRKIIIFESSYTLANNLFKKWNFLAAEAIHRHRRFITAVSGGKSPVEFYCLLSKLNDIDRWMKTQIYLADERFVPLDDKDSNYRLIKETLLNYVPIPPGNVHPVPTHEETLEIAAEAYKDEILKYVETDDGGIPRFDLILLGIGDDGHTASLFPGQEGIDIKNRLITPFSSPNLKEDRISFSLSAINRARTVIFLVQGPKKAKIVKEIIELNSSLPAALVQPDDGELLFYLDKDAAQLLVYHDNFSHQEEAIVLN